MQATYRYRRLSRGDLTLMRDLMRVFGQAFREEDTYAQTPPRDAYLVSLLAKQDFIALVAIQGNEVGGGLTAYVLQKPEQERSEIYLYDLAVAEAHRRRGIARALVKELCRIGKDLGAFVVFVQADPPDLPAIRLYESLGSKEAVFHFDIEC